MDAAELSPTQGGSELCNVCRKDTIFEHLSTMSMSMPRMPLSQTDALQRLPKDMSEYIRCHHLSHNNSVLLNSPYSFLVGSVVYASQLLMVLMPIYHSY